VRITAPIVSLGLCFLLLSCQQQNSVFKDISTQYRPENTTSPAPTPTPTPTPTIAPKTAPPFIDNPYQLFLHNNQLPSTPLTDENLETYSQRLRRTIDEHLTLQFVNQEDHPSASEDHPFTFGALELKGLMVFLNTPYDDQPDADEIELGGIGDCFHCHTPPTFGSDMAPSLRQQYGPFKARLTHYRTQAKHLRANQQAHPYSRIALNDSDIQALNAFLQALNQTITPPPK